MDMLTLIGGVLGGTALKTLLDFGIDLLKNKREDYDNWQEDRKFFQEEFKKMHQELSELYTQVAELKGILIANNIPLPNHQ